MAHLPVQCRVWLICGRLGRGLGTVCCCIRVSLIHVSVLEFWKSEVSGEIIVLFVHLDFGFILPSDLIKKPLVFHLESEHDQEENHLHGQAISLTEQTTVTLHWQSDVLEWRLPTGSCSVDRPPTRWTDDLAKVRNNWMQTAQGVTGLSYHRMKTILFVIDFVS